MDIALLFVAVGALCAAVAALVALSHARRDLELERARLLSESEKMKEGSEGLAKLHNDHAGLVKALKERVETLEMRFHGLNPLQKRTP